MRVSRCFFVAALVGLGGTDRADRVAWLDQTWTVDYYSSTFEEATGSHYSSDEGISVYADVPADPAFDLREYWEYFTGHSVTMELSRDFQVEGPGPGRVSMLAELRYGGIIGRGSFYEHLYSSAGFGIASGGIGIGGGWVDSSTFGRFTEYGPAGGDWDFDLDLDLAPGTYTFYVSLSAGYMRRESPYTGLPFVTSNLDLYITGIEPPVGVVVPEPSALALGVVGMVGLGLGLGLGCRRRRRAAAAG